MRELNHYLRQLIVNSPNILFQALKLKLEEHESYWTGRCPIHVGADNPFGFTIYKNTMRWICHTHQCHTRFSGIHDSADIFKLVEAILHCNPGQAIDFVKGVYGVGLLDQETLARLQFDSTVMLFRQSRQTTVTFDYPPAELEEFYNKHWYPFYEERGYDKELLKRFGVGYCPKNTMDWYGEQMGLKDGYFAERMTIPVHDMNGRLVGFTGRRIRKEMEPKWLHSPGLSKSALLYNWHRASKYFVGGEVIIVESPGVVWAWSRAGMHNVVASLNATLSEKQVNQIVRCAHARTVVIAYDDDGAGRDGIKRACRKMSGRVNINYIPLEDLREDPKKALDYDNMSPEQIQTAYRRRRVYIQ